MSHINGERLMHSLFNRPCQDVDIQVNILPKTSRLLSQVTLVDTLKVMVVRA